MNQPYALFAGSYWYPSGGWADYRSAHFTAQDAIAEGNRLQEASDCDWWHVIDLSSKEVVAKGRMGDWGWDHKELQPRT